MLNNLRLFIFVFFMSHGVPLTLPAESRALAYEIGGMALAVTFLMLTGEFIIRAFWDSTRVYGLYSRILDFVFDFYIGIFDDVLPGERARWKDRLDVLDQRQSIYRKLLMSEGEKAEFRFVMFSNIVFASGLALSFFIGIMAYMQRDFGMQFDEVGVKFAGVLCLLATIYGFILFARFNRAMDRKYRSEYESRFEEVTIDQTTFIRERETAAAGA